MIEAALGDRVVVGLRDGGLTGAQLASRAAARRGVADRARDPPASSTCGVNDEGLPVALFAAAVAGVPFNPINYRLSDEQLAELIGRNPGWVVIADPLSQPRVLAAAEQVLTLGEWAEITDGDDVEIDPRDDPDEVAVVLFTSGTSSEPKAALLRHRHLTSYVLGATELASCDEDDAVLVSVPPYHIAGMANLLTNLYSGRRIVYLDAFDPEGWLKTVEQEGITHAMVVPTMLARIVDAVERGAAPPSELRTLAYGGARMPVIVLERALALFPDVGFVNAYGLTETSSTIAVLGPDDHRDAVSPTTRPCVGASARRAGRCRASRSSCATSSARSCPRARRASSGCAASRCRASTRPARCSTTRAGSAPRTAAASTTTATSSSRAGPTTPSSAAARTSPRRRSRTRSCPTRRSTTPAWSASPTTSGASGSPPSSC